MGHAKIFLDHAAVAQNFLWWSVGYAPSRDQHDDTVGKLAYGLHRVLDDEQRATRLQLVEHVHHASDLVRRKTAHGLVQHDEAWLQDKPHRELQAPLLEQGEAAGLGIEALIEAQPGEELAFVRGGGKRLIACITHA